MRSRFCVAYLSTFLPLILIGILSVPSLARGESSRVYPGQYVVDFVQTISGGYDSSILGVSTAGGEMVRQLGPGVGLVRDLGVITPLEETVPWDGDTEFCSRLVKGGWVSACSPNFEVRISETPNDPRQDNLYGMPLIGAPSAWDVTKGASDVVVAIIDTGVDYTHPDLAANIWSNPGEIANGRDDDNNGYIDDLHGINAAAANGDPFDDNGHGTHVAGTIGAVGNNGVGVAGVNWRVKIMALKFLNSSGSGSLSAAIEAINYMVAMKQRGINIKVVNNSWGGGGFSQSLFNAIARTAEVGIVFAAAAGNEANDNDSNPSYPASYNVANVISVGAIDRNLNLASFSNFGSESVHIAAPGVDIESTYPGNKYKKLSGTSMATPHVAGAIALLAAAEPGLSAAGLRERVILSGVEASTISGVVQNGRYLNVGQMVGNITSPTPTPTPTPLPCTYSETSIPYAPNTQVDSAPIVVSGDELTYYSVNLPFSFPYYTKSDITAVTISPNGVLYLTGNAPSGMDYLNGDSAPKDSIAALHTDLIAESEPFGVRVLLESEAAHFVWEMRHYAARQGWVKVHLTIRSDGSIEDYIEFSDPLTEAVIQGRATIGLRGSVAGHSDTYARNSTLIQSGLGLRFQNQCAVDAAPIGPIVDRIEVVGASGRTTRPQRKVSERSTMGVELHGSGSGQATLRVAFNQRLCESSKTVSIVDGFGTVSTRLPLLPKRYRTVSFISGSATKTVRIGRGSSARTASVPRLSTIRSTQRFERVCDRVLSLMDG